MLCIGILPIGFYNSPNIYIILRDYDTFRDFTMDRNKCSSPDLKPNIHTNVRPTSRSSGEETTHRSGQGKRKEITNTDHSKQYENKVFGFYTAFSLRLQA